MDSGMRILLSVIAGVLCTVSFIAGSIFGRYEAAEHFYDRCLSGEIFFDDGPDKKQNIVGCAEIARKIR